MAVVAGVSQRTFSSWENGVIPQQWEALVALAREFGFSIDYLLGLTDDPTGVKRDLSEDEARLVALWRALSPARRRDLARMGRLWAEDEAQRAANLAQATALHAQLRAALVLRYGEEVGVRLYHDLVNGEMTVLLDMV